MNDVIKEYSNDDITVVWQPGKCSHSTVCAKTLDDVFNPNARPWVNMQGSDSESIISTVRQCPSGALSIKGDEITTPAATKVMENVTIKVLENGPLLVKGDVSLSMTDKAEQQAINPALCRCGASENKPFCDGSHARIGFKG